MATESKTKPPEEDSKQSHFVQPQDRRLPRLRDHAVDEWWLNVDYVSEGLCDKHDKKDKH